jgi:hypothetical protein
MRNENRLLVEARTPILIFERVTFTPTLISESTPAKRYRVAKVAHADRMNSNERIYTRAAFTEQIERAKDKLIPAGRLAGKVDHTGRLSDACILWRDLKMESDGSVMGEFSVIENHSRGRDLKAQIDAGMCIGFSTAARATAREPTPVEREQYGIPDDADYPVVIDRFELISIDAVDDPSVADAWLKQEAGFAGFIESAWGDAPRGALAVAEKLAESL